MAVSNDYIPLISSPIQSCISFYARLGLFENVENQLESLSKTVF